MPSLVVPIVPIGPVDSGDMDGTDNGSLGVVGRSSSTDGLGVMGVDIVVGDTTGFSGRVDGRIVFDGWDDTGATDDGNVRSIRTTESP